MSQPDEHSEPIAIDTPELVNLLFPTLSPEEKTELLGVLTDKKRKVIRYVQVVDPEERP